MCRQSVAREQVQTASSGLGWWGVVSNLTRTSRPLGLRGEGRRKSGAAATLATGTNANAVFTMEEVAQHNSAVDCWLVIKGKVGSKSGLQAQ
jgi:cytochrome b involved in lipid metabolism